MDTNEIEKYKLLISIIGLLWTIVAAIIGYVVRHFVEKRTFEQRLELRVNKEMEQFERELELKIEKEKEINSYKKREDNSYEALNKVATWISDIVTSFAGVNSPEGILKVINRPKTQQLFNPEIFQDMQSKVMVYGDGNCKSALKAINENQVQTMKPNSKESDFSRLLASYAVLFACLLKKCMGVSTSPMTLLGILQVSNSSMGQKKDKDMTEHINSIIVQYEIDI